METFRPDVGQAAAPPPPSPAALSEAPCTAVSGDLSSEDEDQVASPSEATVVLTARAGTFAAASGSGGDLVSSAASTGLGPGALALAPAPASSTALSDVSQLPDAHSLQRENRLLRKHARSLEHQLEALTELLQTQRSLHAAQATRLEQLRGACQAAANVHLVIYHDGEQFGVATVADSSPAGLEASQRVQRAFMARRRALHRQNISFTFLEDVAINQIHDLPFEGDAGN